jgi:gluconokinase
MAALPAHRPVFVAFSAAMHGLLVMDRNNAPITNCIIWADNRAGEIAEDLKNTAWGKDLYHITGVPVHPMSPLCKLIWLKENEPAIFNQAHKFVSIKEYVYYRIFNEYVVDTSIASTSGLLNLRTLTWDEKILDFLDIDSTLLSRVVSPKYKHVYNTPEVPGPLQQWMLPNETPVIIGGSDGALANLGTGSTNENSMAISIGTSGAARVVVAEPATDPARRTFCYHVKDKAYIIGGPSNNGAVVLEWLKNNLLETKESFEELFEKAATVDAGSDGLVFVPYILGERAPVWNSKARGIYCGLTIKHSKSHLVRACMEGVIYSMYSIAKILLEQRDIKEIHATGGFVNSPLWVQILADVCNIKVLVSGAVESSALGAVIIGMEALELNSFPEKTVLSLYEPNVLNNETYMKAFKKFEHIYETLHQEVPGEVAIASSL